MPIFDIYSKRQKLLRGEVPDVYQYEDFNDPFRNQVIHILKDTLGDGTINESFQAYEAIQYILCKEYGQFTLSEKSKSTTLPNADIFRFIEDCSDDEKLLDIIETSIKYIDLVARKSAFYQRVKVRMYPDDAIEELNHRFLEHGLGYQYEFGKIIRID